MGAGACGVALALACAAGCKGKDDEPALSKTSGAEIDLSKVPVPAADGPKLGALADVTPVLQRPEPGALQVGYLHAGAQVARAEQPISHEGCQGGWYPIRPRGFVCTGSIATIDLEHPTLVAMALRPKTDQALPFTYARTTKATKFYKRDPERDDAVVEAGKVGSRAGMAIVGSWSAQVGGATHRLGMLTNGKFIKAAELKAAEPSEFEGVAIDGEHPLPVGFVVKRGVRRWQHKEKTNRWEKADLLSYHEKLTLTGRYRTKGGIRYWELSDGQWVRYRDVTVVLERHEFPDFAVPSQKWIDISIITGTAILYEGKKPVFVTLVSVGRDRLGDPKETASTAQGDFEIVGKHITAAGLDPKGLAAHFEIYDLPWVMELSSGQLMHGSFWHNRFGIEHGPGNVQWTPRDAMKVWNWTTPTVGDGWHGVNQRPEGKAKTIVRIRK